MIESFYKQGLKSFVEPAGGYYLFFKYNDHLDKPLSSYKFSEMLNKEKKCSHCSGKKYLVIGVKGYIRVSFATDETNIQKRCNVNKRIY